LTLCFPLFQTAQDNVRVQESQQAEKYHWFMTFDRKHLKPFFRAKKAYVAINDHADQPNDEAQEETLEMDEIPAVKRLRSDLGE